MNAVLQLLVNSPPFWSLLRELVDLKGQRGAGVPETGGGPTPTPLVDAALRFFKEYDNVVDLFEPPYMYDAMKEKRRLKPLLVRSRTHVAAS